ncbi:hypothetical protein GQ597_11935, partial [Gilliamella sp. Pra-s65]
LSPQEKKRNTVCYPRTVSLSSLAREGLIAIEDENTKWAQVTALDEQMLPIQGWVNIKDNAQAHIKRRSPWHWTGFETIEEKATISELTKKLSKNRSARLDIEDCTEAMLTVLRILAKSGYNHYLWKSLPDKGKNKVKEFLQLLEINNKNPFTKEQFKAALRTSGT